MTMRKTFLATALMLAVWLFLQPGSAQRALAQDDVIFDFNTNNGLPLVRGEIISSVTSNGLTMAVDVESNGANNVAMIFDTNLPGPDPDLGTPNQACPGGGPGVGDGGAPGTIGENCEALGNVLIIPNSIGADVLPNDDSRGGVITLTFSEPVRIVRIDLLDIDEENTAPRVEFLDLAGNPTLDPLIPDIVGDNGHEQFSDFPADAAANISAIRITFPGSGALDKIVVRPAQVDGEIKMRKYVNGFDANDPLGDDVPVLKPGTSVIWTYHVTNTGNIAYPMAQVAVTDSDRDVTPTFSQVLSGNGNEILEPGEIWAYVATGIMPAPLIGTNPSIVENLCPPATGTTAPLRTGYKNIGTVTVPDRTASDPAHICLPEPGIEMRKYVNGFDANNAEGNDVPRIAAGETVTWTYHVTNTGEISYLRSEVVVTDSDPNVTPRFDQVLIGNDDEQIDPDEVWVYIATGTMPDLQTSDNPSVKEDLCPQANNNNGPKTRGYQNIGTVSVGDLTASDPAHICELPGGGVRIRKFVNGADANIPNGDDVPKLVIGETVTWTYHVTNTGRITYTEAEVIVTDNDSNATPVFSSVLVGNEDRLLEPNEVWVYQATLAADNIVVTPNSPLIIPNGCHPGSETTPPADAYRNIGTVTVPGATASDLAHLCIEPDLAVGRTERYTVSYTVLNDGPIAVENVRLFAGSQLTVLCPMSMLAAGDFMVCAGHTTDIGYRDSIAWVIGTPVGGGSPIVRWVQPNDAANLTVEVMLNGKDATNPSAPSISERTGELLIQITNSGKVDLAELQVTISSGNSSGEVNCELTTLTTGGKTLCRGELTLRPGPQVWMGNISVRPSTDTTFITQSWRAYAMGQE